MNRLVLPLLASLGLASSAALFAAEQEAEPAAEKPNYKLVTVAEGLEFPWSLAFLPDGRMLVTERPGRLRIVTADGQLSPPVTGVPAVFAQRQGGLLDVVLDPQFASNARVYLSYAEADAAGLAGTAVARGKLVGNALTGVEVIYRQTPKSEGGLHFGSRLAFAPDGKLFITQGDRYLMKDMAQTLDNDFGKVVRVNPDGSIPTDNPFVRTAGARPEIWSYGHRNMQGAAIHPQTGKLWTHEHGAMGGDEINLDEAGKNYGWPVITWGINYDGKPIGIGTTKEGMEQPLLYWKPSIAPSGMAFYTGDKFAAWRGNLFVGSMKFAYLNRIELDGTKVKAEHKLLTEVNERIRSVRQGPDGYLYVTTDTPKGRVLRLEPG
ncbi:PQQ-dependent sugar dehydrogenase [uncultured Nevskia sp.]|uniref:PQQ-dependent sugar dehydrogenase n=1 Tax=uncultured Nevskia sp. TaxID=228950 RepID=UPI0025EB27D5|nr:PQQ-dependent sugar dehydrogenase [uncultured Nevskia sp.]